MALENLLRLMARYVVLSVVMIVYTSFVYTTTNHFNLFSAGVNIFFCVCPHSRQGQYKGKFCVCAWIWCCVCVVYDVVMILTCFCSLWEKEWVLVPILVLLWRKVEGKCILSFVLVVLYVGCSYCCCCCCRCCCCLFFILRCWQGQENELPAPSWCHLLPVLKVCHAHEGGSRTTHTSHTIYLLMYFILDNKDQYL